ncbi:MbtH family protein [Streptomyces sp. NPDC028635]|uniref:MbtH family protein n=1 Tax=Streptomyces sp. NPDC028635 TaxID=3154800 RepID=UPI0033DB55CB
MYEPQDPTRRFDVVVNDEGQHSLWPADRTRPAGWRPLGFSGSHQECLDHVAAVWTDIRPLTTRRETSA